MKRFVVASDVRGDREKVAEAAQLAGVHHADLVLIGDIVGDVLAPAERNDYEAAVGVVGQGDLKQRVINAARKLKTVQSEDAKKRLTDYQRLIGTFAGHDFLRGTIYEKVVGALHGITRTIIAAGIPKYHVLADCLQTVQVMAPDAGLLDWRVLALDGKALGGIGICTALGIRPTSRMPEEFVQQVSPSQTSDYIGKLDVLLLNAMPTDANVLGLQQKVVILAGEAAPTCASSINGTIYIREGSERISLYEIDGNTLMRTLCPYGKGPHEVEKIDLGTFAIEQEPITPKKRPRVPYAAAAIVAVAIPAMLGMGWYNSSKENRQLQKRLTAAEHVPYDAGENAKLAAENKALRDKLSLHEKPVEPEAHDPTKPVDTTKPVVSGTLESYLSAVYMNDMGTARSQWPAVAAIYANPAVSAEVEPLHAQFSGRLQLAKTPREAFVAFRNYRNILQQDLDNGSLTQDQFDASLGQALRDLNTGNTNELYDNHHHTGR